ncbi:restriction endonuclease [Aeromonas rivipollensis]
MFTTVDKVKNWKDLQSKVCQLFDEMGYETEIEKTVELAGRGKKEVDVFIKDPSASHNQIYLVECKHWNHRVNQDVVHGFKTVMEGTGANTGYIVSKKGFQAGAYEAIRYTNIKLLTFEELQHLYGNEWFRKKDAKLEDLRKQLGDIYRNHFEQGSRLPIANNIKFISHEHNEKLTYFHRWVGSLMLSISSIYPKNYLGPEPVCLAQDPTDPLKEVNGWFEIHTVREYFEIVESSASKCLAEFQALYNEASERFDELNDEEYDEQADIMLKQFKEEMPVRVLKNKISDAEYQRLLKLLA